VTLSPNLRIRLWTAASAVAAVFLGTLIAQGSFFLPSLVAGALGAVALTQIQPVRIGTLLLGFALFGYIVGNRGFAQITLTQNLPILPAEFVLGVTGLILIFQAVRKKASPVRKDFLNVALFIWIVLSSVRVFYDLQKFGIIALRDYATVYYAAFFYVAQDAGRTGSGRSFLRLILLMAMGALAVISPLYDLFPSFFLEKFTFRQIPVIFFKGDLLGTFAAAGSLLFYACFERRRSWASLAVCLVLAALAMESNNRASMVGLVVACVALAIGGRWRYPAIFFSAAVGASCIILAVAFARNTPWQQTQVYETYEKVISIGDPTGQGNYIGNETSNKGDNNAFRWIWWQLTVEETMRTNPWLGMGWGYDLAENFERLYYPEGNDEFAARSPHSIFVTLFGRTGAVGLIAFAAVTGAILVRSVKSIRAKRESAYLWAAVLVILSSSAFGVVLEGPMGAVIFWAMLGLASSYDIAENGMARDDTPSGPQT
jgi:hypothetical protein